VIGKKLDEKNYSVNTGGPARFYVSASYEIPPQNRPKNRLQPPHFTQKPPVKKTTFHLKIALRMNNSQP
jgi:hypothetical protein